jgi:cell division protein FtsB
MLRCPKFWGWGTIMSKTKVTREVLIMLVTLLATYHAGRAIYSSVERQVFLHRQTKVLRIGQAQSQEINKELREGLSNYRSSSGLERLARERLNLAGPDEIVVRIGK